MRKRIFTEVQVANKIYTTANIHENLINTGAILLEYEPRSKQLSKDIMEVLKKHNLIDAEDERVRFDISIDS